MGLQGTEAGDVILAGAQNAAAAAGNLALAHEAASAAAKDLAYRQQEQAKALAEYARKLEAHTLHGAGRLKRQAHRFGLGYHRLITQARLAP
jgi:hypothetical protein